MQNKLFVGVIFYNCPKLETDRVESVLFVASDWTEAERKTCDYALEYARKTKLSYRDFKVFVQAQRVNQVEDCLRFVKTGLLDKSARRAVNPKLAARQPNLSRERIGLRINGKRFAI